MPLRPAVLSARRLAAAVAAIVAIAVAAPAAAQTSAANKAPDGGGNLPLNGTAAVDQVINVYTGLEIAWRVDRRCRLLPTAAWHRLDWLESKLDQVVRDTLTPDTRNRIGELASQASRTPPFAGCGSAARINVVRVMPAAALLVAEFTGHRYRGDETYQRFLADGYFQARATLAVDARCRNLEGEIAAEPAMRGALKRTADALASRIGAARVARLDADATKAAGDGQCGSWLGQAVVDAAARLDRLTAGLARDAATDKAGDKASTGTTPAP